MTDDLTDLHMVVLGCFLQQTLARPADIASGLGLGVTVVEALT